VALRLGLSITGTLGVILKCKKSGILELVREVLNSLEKNNFRISKDLKNAILNEAQE